MDDSAPVEGTDLNSSRMMILLSPAEEARRPRLCHVEVEVVDGDNDSADAGDGDGDEEVVRLLQESEKTEREWAAVWRTSAQGESGLGPL